MSGPRGSRYILGFSDSVAALSYLPVGESGSLILSPDEPNALQEVSKSLKASFYRKGKNCVIRSSGLLIETEQGIWKQSHLVCVTSTERGAA